MSKLWRWAGFMASPFEYEVDPDEARWREELIVPPLPIVVQPANNALWRGDDPPPEEPDEPVG